ncbi:site-specific integrase [Pseudonocardia petroleophila]|uniref:Site-specific integrase n=1 Tax=Pseudonocardia petroleophila TaxID=37331 RepID=A0A7G7MLS3_9PSEU|nr:site-specific integrase [Pseudonocardia petroleophila]QNG53734.1 site-specific integrase [Pseudonocardia petroleophila]
MTTRSDAPVSRQRGSIRRRARCYEVRVSAGEDPSTGERIVLVDSVEIEGQGDRAERAAYREAEKLRTKLLADADALKVARTKATVGALLERWMAQHEIDATTRMTYESQIRMYIVPALGDVPLVLFVRDASQRLETLYSRLRKCRALCSGKPFIERHVEKGSHDCAAAGCKVHVCKPYAASSVRSIHAILSGSCSAAVRWGWISFNPMPSVRPPAKPRPQPRPPTSEQMARIVEAAWSSSAEWGLYVWLSAVLGARRGEVVALQWEDVDLAAGVVRLDENYVRTNDGMVLKDTKSHQMRRVSIDAPTVELLRQHREDCAGRLALLGISLTDRTWVFSAKPDLSSPRDPASLTRRYGRLVAKLGIDTMLKELRHYSATELLTAGVDLRTVAGRLGHGDGTTTLRHYAAWVGSADSAAAGVIGGRMPVLRPVDRS